MRQVVLDTETTGLNPKLGDRIIEVGCVEILSRSVGERHFHAYVNPERDIEEAASRVHGLTREDLLAKPKFAEIALQFLDYVRGAELIIHNADFDVEFLDLELGLAGLGRLADHVEKITDTLAFARELHPGRKNSLDALCERYFVANSHRTLHGALLDARLLAECYLDDARPGEPGDGAGNPGGGGRGRLAAHPRRRQPDRAAGAPGGGRAARALPRRAREGDESPCALEEAGLGPARSAGKPLHARQLAAGGRQVDLIVDEVHRRVVAELLDLLLLERVLEGALELGLARGA